MLVKRLAAYTHLSPTISEYSDISVASDWFFNCLVKWMSVFNHILLSPGCAPGTIAVNFTRLERWFSASKTPRCIYPSILYLQPFLRYRKLLVENCYIFIPHLCLAAPQGVAPSKFRENLDTYKTRMNGLSCAEESITKCSAVLIQ